MRGYAKIIGRGNAGEFLAPRSTLRIWMRNRLFASRLLLRALLWTTDRFATDIDLPDYASPVGRA
jgi:hypothetical protein